MDFGAILYEISGDIAVIKLDRPEKKNAISLELSEEVARRSTSLMRTIAYVLSFLLVSVMYFPQGRISVIR